MKPTVESTRPAAVAGLFYAGARDALHRDVEDALGQARHASLPLPKVLIVPHAGYVYSGSVAARAYARLRASADTISRVVILGPCHRVAVKGLAAPTARAFSTPLGNVPVDAASLARIDSFPQVARSDAAHAREHSIEVQLPFLQRVLGDFSIVPLAVGDATPGEVAQVLDALWGGSETLIVISSDLSHYHDYESARQRDTATVNAILRFDTGIDHEQACGATPIAGLLALARRRKLEPELIAFCNSGDTAGDKERVVGYAAFAFTEATKDAMGAADEDEQQGRDALKLARAAIDEALGGPPLPATVPCWLDAPGACFVTLRQEERLRGCVGSLRPQRPLRDDIVANARAAALSDPRFLPLEREDLTETCIEVSVLDATEPIGFTDRASLLRQLVPGEDGLIVTAGSARATFLPQVWEVLPDAGAFVDELMRKSGIPRDTPLRTCRFERYRVRKWVERPRR
jgi:AmmeMemoRadiSam system protein B/AmmeMemoRadiSam system protein A